MSSISLNYLFYLAFLYSVKWGAIHPIRRLYN